ncbi:molybdopterin-dependent oxidoreductase [Nostocoides vanveenii]|uniref:Molybdopterin-dependent oxidoreductase n=1 Tax=Nostocoides vanveenii TaxID=330835 RepID=A0ABN2KBG7_9MICO
MRTSRRDAWAGISAVAAGAGVGHLVASIIAPDASPVLAIGSAIIDAAPTPLKEFAVRWLGTADKPVLVAGVALGALAFGAVAGVLQRRGLGIWLILVLAATCAWATTTRPSSGSYAIVPSLLAGLIGMAVLTGLTGRADGREPPAAPSTAAAALDRRTTIGSALAVAGGLVAGGVGVLRNGSALPADAVTALPRSATPLPPLAVGLEQTTPGLTAFRTPVADFYRIDTALAIPRVSLPDWRLTIDGDVDAPYDLTYADLLALPMMEADITLNCVSNPVGGDYIGSTRWLGVPVRDVLRRARIRASADQILSTSVDGMTISTPVDALLDDRGALLAVAMDGRPLTPMHGYPVRLVTPGLYGYVGATKWLTRLTATTYAAQQAYWTERGWAERAEVQTQARIDLPRDRRVAAGPVVIAGVAWSQARQGISRVEVRVDDGDWVEADLGPDAGGHYWRQWRTTWKATASGRHTVTVRAVDGTGAAQTDQVADPFPSGATGLHTLDVEVD